MCFSNLPIEFDEEGNPYLTDEAEDVDRPSASEVESESGRGCSSTTDDVALADADPEAMYEAILETVPRNAREQLTDSRGDSTASGTGNDPAGRTEGTTDQ